MIKEFASGGNENFQGGGGGGIFWEPRAECAENFEKKIPLPEVWIFQIQVIYFHPEGGRPPNTPPHTPPLHGNWHIKLF